MTPSADAAPPKEAAAEPETAGPDVPHPSALLEIYWRYLWGDTGDEDQA